MREYYHFVGIGGIGMSGIAQLLLRSGYKVSGSDVKRSSITEELRALGAQIFIGHNSANIDGQSVVVYSSAIKEDNPEIIAARKNSIPLIKRAEALARLMHKKSVITVAGSHGKTTTTSLISYMLLEAGLHPTVAIGGILKNIDTNAFLGSGEFFVAEADESDGSFLHYRPKYSIITNIDHEHLDYYKDFENELRAFKEFINNTDPEGCIFCCADDQNLLNLVKDYKNKKILFGLEDNADIYPKNIKFENLSSWFDCVYKGKLIGRFYLSLGGYHNISNALSVIALALELGIDLEYIKKTLKDYKGAKRRLEVKLDENNYLIVDDYAHHPTEIKATLEAAKKLQRKRMIAVFQPHRYTRTQLLLEEFGDSFNLADYVIITDIYPASEPPIEGVHAKLIVEKIKARTPDKEVVFLPKQEIIEHISGILMEDDLVITLGAGDIIKICDELVERIKK
jgi:UDP-N-acetylmuramate--alanine ligase